jgi:hypothetical protein
MELPWKITSAVVPAALALGAKLMSDSSFSAHIGACACFLLAGVWLAVVGAMWLYHKRSRDWTVWSRVALIALYAFVATPYLVWSAWPSAQAQTPPTINGNCNNVGSNNFNCNTLNFRPGPWRLIGERAQALAAIVKSDQDITSFYIRYAPMDQNAQSFASELQQAFVLGGMKEKEFARPLGIDFLGIDTIPSGVWFYIKSATALPGIKPIMTFLKDANIPIIRHVQVSPDLPDDKAILVVVGRDDVIPNSPDLLR